jgi:hypothetical protein
MKQNAKVEWMLGNGKKVTYTVALQLQREINLDGDKDIVPCCEIAEHVDMDGESIIPSLNTLTTPAIVNGKTVVASLGLSPRKLGLTQETYDAIKAARIEIEQHPAWIKKQKQIAKNEKELDALYSSRKRNGLCPKCGSYCQGDCSAE